MIERLMARVDREGPIHPTEPEKGRCWISSHRKVGNGYPQICGPRSDGSRAQQYTHRVMWEHLNGSIPADRVVMHTCDNRACCNPDHLRLGTQADNVRDMMVKGRSRYAKPMSFTEIGHIQALKAIGTPVAQIAKQMGRDLNTVRKAVRKAANPDQPDLFGFPA
ncbi:HNH endonuclease [Gluconobacter roseus]|nr:HNH endonuclease [Gluconobacter roseus]